MQKEIGLILALLLGISIAAGQPRKLWPAEFNGAGMPALHQYTQTSTDPARDQAIDHLDIVADFFTYSQHKYYTAIQTRGGGFPLSGKLGFPPYYSYMYMIANPQADPKDPKTIVWALVYMKVSLGGIKPGLYKITGKKAENLIRIGDLEVDIDRSNNLLRMSCDIAPLLADPDFKAWFDPQNPVLGTGSMTNKTTLKGFTPTPVVTDTSPGARVHLQK